MGPNTMMDIAALASDYDETLACNGRIERQTLEALLRFKTSGRKLLLVTGRELDDLFKVCRETNIFDAVVVENGAVLYIPSTQNLTSLCDHPPREFVEALRERGVHPLSVGRCIVATQQLHYETMRKIIREMGLDMHLVLNRASVMALPSGINKGTGFKLALKKLGLAAEDVVGIGDAENDEAFLDECGLSVVVANALPELKQAADIITLHEHGSGVVEIIEKIMANQLPTVVR
jgi:phosphoglycolate phosphatase (TIGR01487 family)